MPREASLLDRTSSLASRRHFIIGAVFAGAVAVAGTRMPQVTEVKVAKETFEKWVPNTVGPWRFLTASGVVLPPPDSLSDRLYDNLVTRVYEAPGLPVVMLAIAYNNIQSGVLQVHRPEICYPAGGYALSPTEPVEVQTLQQPVIANFFTAKGPDRTEQVLYWTRVGDAFPRSWAEQRLAVIRANLRGRIPDGMLARVSVLSDEPAAAMETLGDFVRKFEAASTPELRRLLLG